LIVTENGIRRIEGLGCVGLRTHSEVFKLTNTMHADNDPVSDSSPVAQQTLLRAADFPSFAYTNDLS
jgi:hypothetical protein